MQRKQSDESGRGICCRLIRFVVVKLTAGQKKEDKSVKKKLIKKESESDIKIYFKEREDSEANAINTTASRPAKERVIMLVNGSEVGSKKMIHENGKSMASEGSYKRPPVANKLEDVRKSNPETLSNDINKKSHDFIQSRLEMMRKHL